MGASTNSFVELCAKTHYSFLEGASHPYQLIERARELGYTAIGVCDRDGVYGLPKSWLSAQKDRPDAPIKLICGAEVGCQLETDQALRLIATDRAAYGVLCRILTEGHRHAPKGKSRVSHADLFEHLHRPGGAGLIVVSDPRHPWLGDLTSWSAQARRVYLAISNLRDGEDARRGEEVRTQARHFGLPILATQVPLLHDRARKPLQDFLTGLRWNTHLADLGYLKESNDERILLKPEEMVRRFQDLPEAVSSSLEICERVHFDLSELKYRYPSEWIPAGFSAQTYLESLVEKGVHDRYPDGASDAVRRQLAHELKLVAELGYADYFLTLWDIVHFARSRKILCQGRGSAANSIVCYVLGVTAVDPVRMDLLFERFLSAERGEPPDIDVDFEHSRREEVIQYVYQKYGRDRAAMVSAVQTYRGRGARRDIARLWPEAYDGEGEPKAEYAAWTEKLVRELKGTPRHLSIHSGGFTLSADPIVEIVPVEPATMEGRTIIQWDKYDLDALGLLKVDLLSLGMLTTIREACDRIGLELHQIPPEDPKTYEMIRRADTIGTFQIESRAQMNMLGRLQPENFYDLVVEVALVRPGPIVGKMVHPYLLRRRGEEPITYPHPKLKKILGRTLGVPLFQEQVMKMAIDLAGFSPGEADQLRRAIGAWRSDGSIERVGARLKEGLLASGVPLEFVERVFQQIKGFAEYGFPESHAASFALIAYASSWLKCHHPAEFLCALLNAQPMGFYSAHTLVDDAKRAGVEVLPVDVVHSVWTSEVVKSCTPRVRLGLHQVKGLSESEGVAIVRAREERAFRSLEDLLSRVGIRSHLQERLALADAFSTLTDRERRDALWQVLAWQALESQKRAREASGQMGLFEWIERERDEASGVRTQSPALHAYVPRPMDPLQAVRTDYVRTGLSVRDHPLRLMRQAIQRLPRETSKQIRAAYAHGSVIRAVGMVIAGQRPPTANGTMFMTLEDEDGLLDCVLFRAIAEEYRPLFEEHVFFEVRGRFERDRNSCSLIIQKMKPVFTDQEEGTLFQAPTAQGSHAVRRPAASGVASHPREARVFAE